MRIPALITLLFLMGCSGTPKSKLICLESEAVGIQFIRPFSYMKTDTLIIDGVKYTHVGFLDSLELGDYLPNQNAVILDYLGKQATENTNEISMGRALARQLKKSGDYSILNGSELLTTGKLKVARTDGKKIKICMPLKYSASLFK